MTSGKSWIRAMSDPVRHWLRRPRSLRLTFAFDASGLRLIDRTPRMKPAPPSDKIDAAPGREAIVAELRSASGAIVYRKRLHHPIPQDVEVFDPETEPHREPVAPAKGSFSVVVPSMARAVEVIIDVGPGLSLIQFADARRDAPPGQRYPLGRYPVQGGAP